MFSKKAEYRIELLEQKIDELNAKVNRDTELITRLEMRLEGIRQMYEGIVHDINTLRERVRKD